MKGLAYYSTVVWRYTSTTFLCFPQLLFLAGGENALTTHYGVRQKKKKVQVHKLHHLLIDTHTHTHTRT